MKSDYPSNDEIRAQLLPAFSVFAGVIERGIADARSCVQVLGAPRPVERAGDFHRAIRTNWRRLCDRDEVEPLLELKEEKDGLDYVIWRTGRQIAIRWGNLNNGRVRRNDTHRSRDVRGQFMLLPVLEDEKIQNMPLVTIAHDIVDEGYTAGIPELWLRSVQLVRERVDSIEEIAEIARFAKPETQRELWKTPKTIITHRETDVDRWVKTLTRAG